MGHIPVQGRKRTRAAAERLSQASAFSERLLAARPAGGKASRARRCIDCLAETHLIGGLSEGAGCMLAGAEVVVVGRVPKVAQRKSSARSNPSFRM